MIELNIVEVVLAGTLAGLTIPAGIVFWSYILYKLIAKSISYKLKSAVLG